MASYKVLSHQDLAGSLGQRRFAIDVLTGLSEQPKSLPSRWFYDDRGSELFARICDLQEYYPTRCETEILSAHADAIHALAGGAPLNVVDLGAGDGRKTNILLEAFSRAGADLQFVPIDISEAAMRELVGSVEDRFPEMSVNGVVSEYFDGLHWLRKMGERRNLVLFLGSNIGNFSFARARVFLRQLWEALNPGDLVLIGFDLKKDIELLERAYNDSQGVTREFNLNMLERINRELGGNFDLAKFRHFATYDVYRGAMESYLLSHEAQTVYVEALQQSFDFKPWEPVHTEYSYKYLVSDIESLAADTGFVQVGEFYDSQRWFTDRVWRVEKQATSVE